MGWEEEGGTTIISRRELEKKNAALWKKAEPKQVARCVLCRWKDE